MVEGEVGLLGRVGWIELLGGGRLCFELMQLFKAFEGGEPEGESLCVADGGRDE